MLLSTGADSITLHRGLPSFVQGAMAFAVLRPELDAGINTETQWIIRDTSGDRPPTSRGWGRYIFGHLGAGSWRYGMMIVSTSINSLYELVAVSILLTPRGLDGVGDREFVEAIGPLIA